MKYIRNKTISNDIHHADINHWKEVFHPIYDFNASHDYRAMRQYALTQRLYKREWLEDNNFYDEIDSFLSTYLRALGWDYEKQVYLKDIHFDPYKEISPQNLIDCCILERLAHPDKKDYSTVQLIYGYMRGGFSFCVNGKDLCKQAGLELPYSTLEVWNLLRNEDSGVRVARNYVIPFRGDIYCYDTIAKGELLKTYYKEDNVKIWSVRDEYGRIWFCVESWDTWDNRMERTFELVEDEADAEQRFLKLNKTYHYTGKRPYFFSSENYDFILHNDVPWEANEQIVAFQIDQLNGAIPPQLYPKDSEAPITNLSI